MSFLDNVILPTGIKFTTTKKSGGFLGSVIMPPKNYIEPAKTTQSGGMEFKTLPNAKLVPDNFIPVGQEIKTPFMQSGTIVPSGGGVGVAYSALKSIIETPEKAIRSLTEFGGITKQTENKQWRVPSYAETAGKNVGQLIDEGMPPTAAVILGGSQVAGEFANDALIFEGIFGRAVSGLATKVARDEASVLAYDFLGRPKTLVEAEKSFKAIQKEFHPDISGSDVMSKQANNAIEVLRKNGVPNQNILVRGLDTLLNKPLSFSKPIVPETKISGFLDSVILPKEPVKAPTTPKTAPETTITPKTELSTSISKAKASGQSFDEWVDDAKYLSRYDEVIKDTPEVLNLQKTQDNLIKERNLLVKSSEGTSLNPTGRQISNNEKYIELDNEITANANKLEKLKIRNKVEQLKAEWDKIEKPIAVAPKPIEVKPKVVKVSSEQLPVGTGETKVSRLEARMKEKLDSVSPEKAKAEGLSTFEQMNKKEQIKLASDYVSKNPDEALQVLKGEVPAPKDLLHNSIALALESQAEITGNAELVSKLASLRSTRFGQEISILTEADPLNVVSQTKNIQIARENAIIKKTGKTISKAKADVKTEIDKIIKEERTLAQIKVAEAEKLLDSITC